MEELLQLLKDHQGEYVSGELLAQHARVTRSGIWKQIKKLRELGYLIESAPRKGYKLLDLTKELHPFEIGAGLKTKVMGRTIYYQKEVDSTNLWAKSLAKQGVPDGTLVIAERQLAGKGRLGRTWASAEGLGIWSSLVLRPQIPPTALAGITIATAVSMAQAIADITKLQVKVKWPNDLLYEDKKLAGILAELNGEMDRVNYLIVGIGLNVNHSENDFPSELAGRASSLRLLSGKAYDRKLIIQSYLSHFEQAYAQLSVGALDQIIKYAKLHSATLGKWVTINRGFDKKVSGEAVDLDQDGSLWLQDAAGEKFKVYSGEIIAGNS